MKLKKHYIFLLAFIFGLGLFQAEAQYTKNKATGSKFKPKKAGRAKPRNYINAIKGDFALGYATYYGDLCDGTDCFSPQLSTSVGLSYRVNESIVLRGSLSWFRLTGDDAESDANGRKKRNLHFRSENIELSAVAVYDIFHYQKMYRRRQLLSPYVFLGIGATYFNPRTYLEVDGKKEWYSLRQYQTEGVKYGAFALVIPYGAGIHIKATPHLGFDLELGLRWTSTDYLDDVSDKYAPQAQLDAIGKQLSDRTNEYYGNVAYVDRSGQKRGSPKYKDAYFTTQIRASYTLKVTKQSYNINSNVSRMRIIKSIKRK